MTIKFWQDNEGTLSQRVLRAKQHYEGIGFVPERCIVGDNDKDAHRHIGDKVHGLDVVRGSVTPGHIGLEGRTI